MRRILVLLFSFAVLFACGQDSKSKYTVPDLAKIKKEISDTRSPYYYPKLWQRFQDNDTLLTLDDYRHLYYGYSFQPGYTSMPMSLSRDSVNNIYNKDSLTTDDYASIKKFVLIDLQNDPFSLSNLNQLTSAYKHLGDRELYARLKYKLNKVADAILSTGDGMSPASGWYVINISHEYDLLHTFGLDFGGMQQLVDGPCDYLTVKENTYNIKGLYFNVTITMEDLEKAIGSSSGKHKSKKEKK